MISVQLKNLESTNYFLLIQDDGAGFPKNINLHSISLGLQLINTLAEQIKGKIHFETGKKGTKYEIIFSLKR